MLKENQTIDLHTHSCYSDGDLTPDELIKLAISKNISVIAITDHDTLLGNKNIDYTSLSGEIEIIPGIELSAKTDIGMMHILGYGIDLNNSDLNKKMGELKENSINSVLSLTAQIKKDYGIVFSDEELRALINAERNIGRPDIAKLCVKYGYASNVQDAFDKYLEEAYYKIRGYNRGLSYEECIDLILKSGGIPVIAHPKTLKRSDVELMKLIKEMVSCGLQGIEVYHSSFSEEETNKYLEIANELGLLVSGGTDYHGVTVKPYIEIGTGKNNNVLIKKLSLLDSINKR